MGYSVFVLIVSFLIRPNCLGLSVGVNSVSDSSEVEPSDKSDVLKVTGERVVDLMQSHIDRVYILREFLLKKNKKRHVRKGGNLPSDDRNSGSYDIEDFAVFVDSPEIGKENIGASKNDKTAQDSQKNGAYGSGKSNLRGQLSDRFLNGSYIHDISIVMKHPAESEGSGRGILSEDSTKFYKMKSATTSSYNLGFTDRLSNAREPSTIDVSQDGSFSQPHPQMQDRTTRQDYYPGNKDYKETIHEADPENFTTVDFDAYETTSMNYHAEITEPSERKDDSPAENVTMNRGCSDKVFLTLTQASDSRVSECLLVCLSNRTNEINSTVSNVDNLVSDPPEGATSSIGTTMSIDLKVSMNVDEPKNYTEESTDERVTRYLEFLTDSRDEEILRLYEKSNNSELPISINDLCLTETCVVKAADVLKRMNTSVDPCQNFYEFACGRFLNKNIPPGEAEWSVFKETESDILFKVSGLLMSSKQESNAPYLSVMKDFYGKCVKTPPTNLLLDALHELGGWPAPHNTSWNVSSVNLQDIAFKWTFGIFAEQNLLFLNISHYNVTDKWILSVDFPMFVQLALQSNSFGNFMNASESETLLLATTLGVDNVTITNSIEEVRVFMEKAVQYANASISHKIERVYTLRNLITMFPYLTLFSKLPSIFGTAVKITDDDLIRVSNVIYLKQINGLIRDTPVKTQVSYLKITAMRSISNLVDLSEDSVMGKYCVKMAWKLYPHLMGMVHAELVDDATIYAAGSVLSQIETQLGKTLLANGWMDETTNRLAKAKLGYISYTVSNRMITNMDMNSSFAATIKEGIWDSKKNVYALLGQNYFETIQHFVDTTSYFGFQVNAHYFANHVLIPLSFLHENIFDIALPAYVNFGGIGIAVGHELIRGLIEENSFKISSKYLAVEQCLINQFSDFNLTGELTKNENLADLFGFRGAYRAYVDWASHNRDEKRLPGLHGFNAKQMFWLVAASNWCQNSNTSNDNHVPLEHRINRQFSNFPAFSSDFNCPLNSPMHSEKKCSFL